MHNSNLIRSKQL